jgi:hypothetical protein
MSIFWHGFEQHPEAHPERPWWRQEQIPHGGLAIFRRLDGEAVKGVRFSGHPYGERTREQVDNDIAEFDRKHPLPAPQAKCGQIWFWPETGEQKIVIDVDPRVQISLGTSLFLRPTQWPPLDAVLVAGPDSPWAPPEVP